MKREDLSPEKQAIIEQIDAEPWPEVYVTGKIPEVYRLMKQRNQEGYDLLMAKDALLGWSKVYAGCDGRPENYGYGMIAIGEFLGGTSSDFLSDLIDKWKNKKRA